MRDHLEMVGCHSVLGTKEYAQADKQITLKTCAWMNMNAVFHLSDI